MAETGVLIAISALSTVLVFLPYPFRPVIALLPLVLLCSRHGMKQVAVASLAGALLSFALGGWLKALAYVLHYPVVAILLSLAAGGRLKPILAFLLAAAYGGVSYLPLLFAVTGLAESSIAEVQGQMSRLYGVPLTRDAALAMLVASASLMTLLECPLVLFVHSRIQRALTAARPARRESATC